MIWQATARAAVAHLRKRSAGTGELARACNVDCSFLDDALAPLVDAGNLIRISAFRNGGAEFDYRFSATWVPVDGDFDLCKGGGHAPVAVISPVAPPAPGKFEQRGLVESKPAHVLRPVLPDDHVANGKSGARSKAARNALERAFHQAPQSLGWAHAPSRAPQPAAADHPDQESAMSSITRKPRPTKATSAQFQICALLMAKGNLTREELLAHVSADRRAFNSAIFNAKAAGRVTFLEKVGRYHLTSEGKAWTGGGANLDNHKAAASNPREVKPQKSRTTDVAIAPIHVVEERSFRCAVYSDGGFSLAKAGQAIELTAVEHAQMLRYLERMAEQAA